MNIGVLGGTFDPIHNGHLAIAKFSLEAVNLHYVLIMPAGHPWLKSQKPVASVEHRVQMVRLAISGNKALELSTIEAERSGITYAVETMAQLHEKLTLGDEIFFIMGEDALAGIPLWKDPGQLLRLCKLAVFTRHGADVPDMKYISRAVPGIEKRIVFVRIEPILISSTLIRENVMNSASIHGLVPDSVEAYIRKHKLYTAEA